MAITIVGSSGASAAAINGASVTLTWATVPSAGDVAIVMNVSTQTSQPAQTVLSGSGAAYTSLISTANGNLRVNIWYRACSSGETTATCSNGGAAQDATAAAGFIFRGARLSSAGTNPTLSQTKGTGTSSQPDSPANNAAHAGDAVISAVCSLANSAAAVTGPTGYLNLISTGATDNRACQLGMSWVASTNTSNTPLSYDPTAYSSFTSAAWMGFTIILQSTDPYTPMDMASFSTMQSPHITRGGRPDVVSY